jgi:hypothetical protein
MPEKHRKTAPSPQATQDVVLALQDVSHIQF